MLRAAHSYATLARWLGPWTPDLHQPDAATRRCVSIRASDEPHSPRPGVIGGCFPAWLYAPKRRRPVGAYLIGPGLHYAGPADPRMDRLCRILATAGYVVLAPFLPDYTSLRVAPTAFDDFRACFDALIAQPETPTGARPAVFSISFGSLLALRLAAEPAYRDRIGALVLFGGYLDWHDTILFCLTGLIDGRPHGVRDPLNQPVVFMNLIDHIDGAPADATPLRAAWRRQVEATWGRPELKTDGRHVDMARTESHTVPPPLRELFLIGCGALPGALQLCRDALSRADVSGFLDPRPHLSGIRCPTYLVHGLDDDVIPYVQSERLAAALPHIRCELHLTGLYGHTSKSGGMGLGAAPQLARELWTMTRILRAFVTAPASRP